MKVVTMTWSQTPVIARLKMGTTEHVTKGGEIKKNMTVNRQNTELSPKIQKLREVNEVMRRERLRVI